MSFLTPDQRNAFYTQEAERTGIHKPILAALYQVQKQPRLVDGELGLGVAPAHRIALEQVNTFASQVEYAANTVRSITNNLMLAGWKPSDLWDAERGQYSGKFLQAIAAGYNPPATDTTAAILEVCQADRLIRAYANDAGIDLETSGVAPDFTYLDAALKTFVEQIPQHYLELHHQRIALVELVRLWHQLDTSTAAIATLNHRPPTSSPADTAHLDGQLLQFVQTILSKTSSSKTSSSKTFSSNYSGYPHQREALLRLTQLWQQLESREVAIAYLKTNPSPAIDLALTDAAAIAFIQRIPQLYQGKGEQRNALVEGFRHWRHLESRSAALVNLGVNPAIFSTPNPAPTELTNAAIRLDRTLLNFVRQIPAAYEGLDYQREALFQLTQLWQGIATREQTIQALFDDLKRMETANRNALEAPSPPVPTELPPRPDQWTPSNIQIHATILPNGTFTWAEATNGGIHLPPNQVTVNAIVHIADLAQQARDRLGRPFHIVRWYSPTSSPDIRSGGLVYERHSLGDAIDFYCDGLTADQLYWFLDPWWMGGLGRYSNYPSICCIDAHNCRTRWMR